MKLNTTGIEGYAEMTPEEKVAALEALDLPEQDTNELTRYKNALNKATSEAADYKRQLREKMSEQEQKDADAAEASKRMQQELADLKYEKTVTGYKASYIAMGYSEELAKATAEALAKGDLDTVISNQKTFNAAQEQAFQAKAAAQQPTPTPGKPLSSKQIEDEQNQKLRMYMGV